MEDRVAPPSRVIPLGNFAYSVDTAAVVVVDAADVDIITCCSDHTISGSFWSGLVEVKEVETGISDRC